MTIKRSLIAAAMTVGFALGGQTAFAEPVFQATDTQPSSLFTLAHNGGGGHGFGGGGHAMGGGGRAISGRAGYGGGYAGYRGGYGRGGRGRYGYGYGYGYPCVYPYVSPFCYY
jgi:hypothetical protein